MEGYLNVVAGQMGISVLLLVAVIMWSAVWKLLALWKAGRKNSPAWFIILALINTVGILDILYIFVFSECCKKKERPKQQRSSRQKSRRRR
jgi:methionyl-tRNA synthetase